MKLLFYLTLLATALALHSSKALEIHIFDVGQADAQLIVFPSGYSILIDCGDRDHTNASGTKHVAKRIQSILGKKKVDIFLLSHFHGDHFGRKGKSGIWYLIEKQGFTFGKFLRRDVGSYNGSKLSNCNKKTMSWKIAGQMADDMLKFICYATSTKEKTKLSKIGQIAYRCNNKQIAPPDKGAKVTILMRDGLGIKDTKYNLKISRNSIDQGKKTVTENDFSICMRIEYQKFVYATCGDMSGFNVPTSTKKFSNVETTVAPMMGEVDAHKVNHHGSGTATNEKWAKTLKPSVAVVTCGGGDLPSKTPLKNLKNVGAKIYTTGDNCDKTDINKVGGITEMGDDVVITVPTNGKTFTVASPSGKHKKTFNIKQNKKAPTACKALG